MLGRSARTVKRGPSFREMTEGHLLTKVLHHFMYDENYILDQVTFGSSPVRDSYWKLLNENGNEITDLDIILRTNQFKFRFC
jgi:hypothetical protein